MTTRTAMRHAPLDLLQAYACGALGPAAWVAVDIHAQHCTVCAARISELEALGGALLAEEDGSPLDVEASLNAVMARLDARAPQERALPFEVMSVPSALRAPYAKALENGRWVFSGPGLRVLDLDLPGSQAHGERPQMMRIEPGYGAPRHRHGAMELTLVLEGAFRDETGVYGPGDLAIATPTLTHRPIAEPGPVCIAYAVSHAPMQFTGVLGLAQRLLARLP